MLMQQFVKYNLIYTVLLSNQVRTHPSGSIALVNNDGPSHWGEGGIRGIEVD
jgi:hypothetical protein